MLQVAALAIAVSGAAAAADSRPWMNKADPPRCATNRGISRCSLCFAPLCSRALRSVLRRPEPRVRRLCLLTRRCPGRTRAQKIVKEMTMEEKLQMLHGPVAPEPCCECFNKTTGEFKDKGCAYTGNVPPVERLGIPPIHMNDGPQGFRENPFPGTTTAWPSSLTVAASWDLKAMGAWGDGMGKEFFAKGANIQLGPGACLARVPRNGRNFEYASGEDPFLGHELIQPVIKGIQQNNVVANAKHYVNNNQETNRGAVSEIVDERTRFEMYYPPFAGAAKAGLGSIMCSCESPLQPKLRSFSVP